MLRCGVIHKAKLLLLWYWCHFVYRWCACPSAWREDG